MNEPQKVVKPPLARIGPPLSTTEFKPGILQNDVFLLVIKYIDSKRDLLRLLLVSRAWQRVAAQQLWLKPSFSSYAKVEKMANTISAPFQTINYAIFVRRLNLTTFASELQDDVFSPFVACERLERLTIPEAKSISTEVIAEILLHYPHLASMDIRNIEGATDRAIIGLSSAAKGLKGLCLVGCTRITDVSLLAVAQNCPNLVRVKLGGLYQITDDGVIAIIENCPGLVEIELTSCAQITDVVVQRAWTRSTRLRELMLGGCSNLTDSAFPAAEKVGTQASGGDLAGPPERDHQHAVDVPLELDIKPSFVPNHRYDQLRILDLSLCAELTDDAIAGITSSATKIRNINLSKCSRLTDKSIESICKLGKQVHYLQLSHLQEITDEAVVALVKACNRLRYIDFSCCVKLTDIVVAEIGTLQKLRRIGFVRVNNITDEGIFHLAQKNLDILERIHLSYCDKITPFAIHGLLTRAKKLMHLSLTGVPSFCDDEFKQYCRSAPRNFTANQRAAFCVFSGSGVNLLRLHLKEVYGDSAIQPGPAEGNQRIVDSANQYEASDEDTDGDDDDGDDFAIIRG